MSQIVPLPNTLNTAFVEDLYRDYLRDPTSVPEGWRSYFERQAGLEPVAAGRLRASIASAGPLAGAAGVVGQSNGESMTLLQRDLMVEAMQDRVDQMVRAFRVRGHMIAQLDPLGLPREGAPELDPAYFGFTEADMDRPFSSRTIKGPPVRTLRDIIARLQNTYCRYIGAQYMHIDQMNVRHWLQERMEGSENRCTLGRSEQFRILSRLTEATLFEEFIQKKFIGAKSFSLEGAESLVPLLDMALERAGAQGAEEVVLGMAHRGRLNVLANILGKSPRKIFREFVDQDPTQLMGRGDVKYHLGYHCNWRTAEGSDIHVALCFNPSHLEFVNPVALGRLRAQQDRLGDGERRRSLAILIHGDAAFAGEGIVQETLNLSELEGYRVGGTLHVIVNNQIGFTTSPSEGRSSIYCSAVGKMLQIPIFHVNGEDPESVAQVVQLALDFRREFSRDVIIDMYCYRRRGHNEADDPSFTQPRMYEAIRRRKTVREGYCDHLQHFGVISQETADEIQAQLSERLELEFTAKDEPPEDAPRQSVLGPIWSRYRGGADDATPEVDTGAPRATLQALMGRLTTAPADFRPHKTLARLLEARRQMASGERRLDWAAAEALAFATLVTAGYRVRLSGQDAGRGTFSQRHAQWHDAEDGRRYCPLQNLESGQAAFDVYNSPLSEAGVLGFDYGFSIAYPDALVLWEAQFGDFVNAAQVIIDQFLSSAEDKWHSLSGLVLLLPHGFEGQGPEHSSARLERFLGLTAEDNMQVTYPSTPAQYFHLLRRQVLRAWRKPLVVMTPKSLLRSEKATSSIDELAQGRFQRILPDEGAAPQTTKRVLLCSGKVYFDLAAERERLGRGDVAILRFEQLYPLSDATIAAALEPYRADVELCWVQEEPSNMGAWPYLRSRFGDRLPGRGLLQCAARPASASPATGSSASHKLEQQRVVAAAFARP